MISTDCSPESGQGQGVKRHAAICASRKKIHDNRGYWHQIESYIKKHSDMEFSHGICPEGMKKLYPQSLLQNEPLPRFVVILEQV